MKRITPSEVQVQRRTAVDDETLKQARVIVEDVRTRGEPALLEHAERLGDWKRGEPFIHNDHALQFAFETLPAETRELLKRTAHRIRAFATHQLDLLKSGEMKIDGGAAGFTLAPVASAGCYAPGGRFPLPSSVLMTAITARVAGVENVIVASPHPNQITRAAAYIAGANEVLAIGGAQAIAALAYGAGQVAAVDMIVGPGNRWVTAAKQIVSGSVGIDMLAGPSELVVVADDSAAPSTIAADLLAQAEHDVDALPVLITPSEKLAAAVDESINLQLVMLPTAATARRAIANGFTVITRDIPEAIGVSNVLAPEHLELMVARAEDYAKQVKHAGAMFLGAGAAEVLGDYGAGPNHVLPTGTTARFTGGLSVMTFLRMRTWLRIDQLENAHEIVNDAVALARLEGLEGHARSALKRMV